MFNSKRAKSTATESECSSVRPLQPVWLLLAIVLSIGIGLGLHQGVPMYRRWAAIRKIEELGGQVTMAKAGPDWLRRWIGDERMKVFDDVEQVYVENHYFDDSHLVYLRAIPTLKSLHLNNTLVSGAGFFHLEGLTNLESLSAGNAPVGDPGLASLTRLKSLKVLVLANSHVTDAGMTHVAGMKNLVALSVHSTRIG